MLKGDKLLLFWISAFALFFCFQVSFASKSGKSLTETARDGSKYDLKIATGAGKIAKHKHKKHEKGKHKSKKSKKKSPRPKISDGDLSNLLDSSEKWKSTENEKSSESGKIDSSEKEKTTENEKSSESSETSEPCGSCIWGEWSEGECTKM